jgi:N-acyl-D-aspartate/D-glutamate deacylase
MIHDLPGDARRFIQEAAGYVATIKSGQITFREGVDQGHRPGELLRGVR